MRLSWVQPEDLLPHQLVQCSSEGIAVDDVAERWHHAGGSLDAPVAGASAEPASQSLRLLARELLDELDRRTPPPMEWIVPELPVLQPSPAMGGSDAGAAGGSQSPGEVARRVEQAWVGRAAGCLLGKPVEKIPRAGIREILERSGQWPLAGYIAGAGVPGEVLDRWAWNRKSEKTSLREVIDGMPEDDDLNFAMLALVMLERYGRELTTDQVAETWLSDLPAGRVFTAERVVYRNLLDGIAPAKAARVRNPFREWIGAQIRTDVYGWVNPGDRTAAARLALVDARLTHTGAGIDGALWVAAMTAAALVLDDPVEIAEAGLEVIDPDSSIAVAVRFGLGLAGVPLDDALDALHAEYGGLHWVHAVNNSALTAYALTASDFGTGVGRAVMGGWDTDSVGATVGSVLGAVRGVPAEWSAPLDNRVATSLPGVGTGGAAGGRVRPGQVAIDELAARTVEVAGRG